MTRRIISLVVPFVLIILTASTFAAENDPPASPEVTVAMQPYFDQYKLAGAIGIIADKSGKVHYKNLLGYADVVAKQPMSEDNVFWIASMTKMFAGASIMMLVDEGKVSLDDPVIKFIPQLNKWMVVEEKDQNHVLLKPLAHPVTIRHVLSHTSGLTGSSELQQVTGSDSTPLKARALSSVTGPLQWQPGDKYAYGNQGMNIAARIVEIVSGMPYEEFLQQRFFDPLGMTETTFWPSESQIARLAGAYGPNKEKTGYARGGIGFLTKPLSDRVRRFPEAGGGLFSTTHDIFRYGLMLANDGELDGKRYLSHAAMDELRKEQTGKTKVNYSLGYHLRNGMFGHDGAYGTDFSGYDYQFRVIDGGHVQGYAEHWREAMAYLWRGWPARLKVGPSAPRAQEVLVPGEDWQVVAEGFKSTRGPAGNASGEVFFADTTNNKLHRIELDGKVSVFAEDAGQAHCVTVGADGSVLTISEKTDKLMRYDASGKGTVVMEGITGHSILARPDDSLYVTHNGDKPHSGTVWLIKEGKKTEVDRGIKFATGMAYRPDQWLLSVAEGHSKWVYSDQVNEDGTLSNKERFFHLHVADWDDDAGPESVCYSLEGRQFIATRSGIQITADDGPTQIILPVPDGSRVTGVAIGGREKDTLFAFCMNKIWKRKIQQHGVGAFFPWTKVTPNKL